MKREAPVISARVGYHSALRHATNVARETIEFPEGTSLDAALAHLIKRHGQGLGEMVLTPEGAISPGLVVFRNGQLVPQGGRDLTLADGDELQLFPRISGGH